MKVYFISGIGGDSRLFTHIELPDGFEAVYIHWVAPQQNEILKHYAIRLSKKINTSEPFILIGLSLGGILATEIAKIQHPVCTILIASVPVSSQLPKYYQMAGRLKLYRIVPAVCYKMLAAGTLIFTKMDKADKKLMRQILKVSNPRFIKWAIKAVLNWKNEDIPQPIYHIHGTKDEVFPINCTRPTHRVNRARHTIAMNRAKEVNSILMDVLPPYLS